MTERAHVPVARTLLPKRVCRSQRSCLVLPARPTRPRDLPKQLARSWRLRKCMPGRFLLHRSPVIARTRLERTPTVTVGTVGREVVLEATWAGRTPSAGSMVRMHRAVPVEADEASRVLAELVKLLPGPVDVVKG